MADKENDKLIAPLMQKTCQKLVDTLFISINEDWTMLSIPQRIALAYSTITMFITTFVELTHDKMPKEKKMEMNKIITEMIGERALDYFHFKEKNMFKEEEK